MSATEAGIPPIGLLGRGGSDSVTCKNLEAPKKPTDAAETAHFAVTKLDSGKTDEWHFLLKSWKRTLRANCEKEPSWVFYDRIHDSIERLRDRGANFVVARNPKDHSQLFGVACTEYTVAHFVFVKRWLRRHGIATKLLDGVTFATSWRDTDAVHGLARKLGLRRIDL